MPAIPHLNQIRLDQMFETLGGRLLFSEREQVKLDAPVNTVHVAVDECGLLLEKLSKLDWPLVVTTPSRIDVIVTVRP